PIWSGKGGKEEEDEPEAAQQAAWRGTIFAKTDADVWLASAFAEYQRLVSEERGLACTHEDKCLCATDHDKAAASLFAARSRYLAAARASGEVALGKIQRSYDSSDWYDIAAGKGVLVLSELRMALGDAAFADMMDGFGRLHGGQEVSSKNFVAAAGRAAGKDLGPFFDYWLNQTGMPALALSEATVAREGEGAGDDRFTVRGALRAEGGPLPVAVEATAEWDGGELTKVIPVEPGSGK